MDIKEEVEAEIHKSISSHAVDNANKHVQAKHWLMSFFFFILLHLEGIFCLLLLWVGNHGNCWN